ncbi:MAG: hypothetical protein PHY13_05825 [Clostridia bacterium]|jgi:hypothetical protein|nr:hypothetical protein [Clostridia bacterium]
MNGESLWEKICNQLSINGEELHTTTGLWFLALSLSDAIIVDRALDHKPSSRLAMKRFISKEEFLNVYPYYELWIKGIPGIRQEARDISQNTSYIFSLIENYM